MEYDENLASAQYSCRGPASCARPSCQSAVCFLGWEGREAQIEVESGDWGGGGDEQSADTLAKICETLVQPTTGSGPAPAGERGLGGAGDGGLRGRGEHRGRTVGQMFCGTCTLC